MMSCVKLQVDVNLSFNEGFINNGATKVQRKVSRYLIASHLSANTHTHTPSDSIIIDDNDNIESLIMLPSCVGHMVHTFHNPAPLKHT